jgi:capsular polysaccharide biosynthesis protein
MNETMEKETDLKDLIYQVTKKWRKIIAGALIIAALAALFQVAFGVILLTDQKKLAEAQEKYAIAVDSHRATGERLQARIANLRDQSANQQEYNDKSVLMKIDPMNKWTGSFQFYVDSKYQIDPSLTYQTPDLTGRLIAAYSSYLRSGELYGELLANTDGVDEIRFLTEIYHVEVDQGAATINVQCIGITEEMVAGMLDFVKTKISERCSLIREAIGSHSYEIMTESIYSTIDFELDERQKANILALANYANDIGETSEALTEWEKEPVPKKKFGVWYTTKQAIKYFVMGGITGTVLMFICFAAAYFLSRTVKTDRDWNLWGIPVLGHVFLDRKKQRLHKLDEWIDQVFDRCPPGGIDQTCFLAACSLELLLKAQGLSEAVVVSHLPRELGETVTGKMDAAENGFRVRLAGDILMEPEAAGKLAHTEKVILLEESQVTKDEDVEQVLRLMKAWGKSILGVVVIE